MVFNDTYSEKEPKRNEPQDAVPDYEKAETDLLRAALRRTYTERFLMATRLYKINRMMQNATVTHQPLTPKE